MSDPEEPATWREQLPRIEMCEFEAVGYLSEIAKDDETTPPGYMAPKPRPDDVWFHIEDVGCSCLWFPGNRADTMRISHTYVRPEKRGMGAGKALTIYSHRYAKDHPYCNRIDVLAAHDPKLYTELGMTPVEKREASGNTMLYLAQTFEG
jgi:GNAT superfamily N-acetyltransferase